MDIGSRQWSLMNQSALDPAARVPQIPGSTSQIPRPSSQLPIADPFTDELSFRGPSCRSSPSGDILDPVEPTETQKRAWPFAVEETGHITPENAEYFLQAVDRELKRLKRLE